MERLLQRFYVEMSLRQNEFERATRKGPTFIRSCSPLFLCVLAVLAFASPVSAQERPSWEAQVRTYCDAREWSAALSVLDAQIARAPKDLDLQAWRARVLTWAGRLQEAEQTYREILAIDRRDPDNWAGLASVCLREGKINAALSAIQLAIQIDSKRADLHAAYARILRAAGQGREAQAEFNNALRIDPANTEARTARKAGRSYTNEIRGGVETDSLSYTIPNNAESASLITRWTSLWSTNLGGYFYQRSGILADKFLGSVTLHAPSFAAVTMGGAIADDNAVIPKSEAFFDFDRGLSKREATVLKGIEFQYGQHWYWYQTARILTLNGATVLYFPRDWSLTLGATGARSAFSALGAEWRPSGVMRLGFPLVAWSDSRLSGNILYAAGAENFASADQIGRFASQTYGGGVRFDSSRVFLAFTYSYQRRTQNRTDSYTGFSYGYRF
jgi:tetratricopeptide (TPR) repeat protein